MDRGGISLFYEAHSQVHPLLCQKLPGSDQQSRHCAAVASLIGW
jgi:hypothetical protein